VIKIIKLLKTTLLLSISLLLISGCSSEQAPQETININARQAVSLLEENDNIAIIDVRSSREYRQGHIPRARLIPYNSPDFSSRINSYTNNQYDTILIYCRRGVRSRRILPLVNEHTEANLYHLQSGIREWINQGFPVHRSTTGK